MTDGAIIGLVLGIAGGLIGAIGGSYGFTWMIFKGLTDRLPCMNANKECPYS